MKMLQCHAKMPNQMTGDCRSQNQRLREHLPNGGKRPLGKGDENCFVNNSTTLTLIEVSVGSLLWVARASRRCFVTAE
jgi:hypothetical protein